MSYFDERDFRLARGTVVGTINQLSVDERWEQETPAFVDAILRHLPSDARSILDYGCGIGRLSKGVLARVPQCSVTGVDSSPTQIEHARGYLSDNRFTGSLPHQLEGCFDFGFCIYVLQHVRAIDLRPTLWNIHSHLAPGAVFVHCSSVRRMSVRRDTGFFFDDRFLGVDLEQELEQLFDPIGDLFSANEIEESLLLKRVMLGYNGANETDDNGDYGVVHRGKVYRKREVPVPYWKIPIP
jgi:SAM-dependent methyltransferase